MNIKLDIKVGEYRDFTSSVKASKPAVGQLI